MLSSWEIMLCRVASISKGPGLGRDRAWRLQSETMSPKRNPTRAVRIGSVTLGGSHPVVVQSMCATKTVNVEATSEQAEQLRRAGAGIVRIAVDSAKDAEAVAEIRKRTEANLSVDLQENYRLAEK